MPQALFISMIPCSSLMPAAKFYFQAGSENKLKQLGVLLPPVFKAAAKQMSHLPVHPGFVYLKRTNAKLLVPLKCLLGQMQFMQPVSHVGQSRMTTSLLFSL